MAHIQKKILINAPVDKVYAFARDPQKWSTFYNGLSEAQEIKGAGEPGTVLKANYTMAGMAFPVTSRVLEDNLGPKAAKWRGEIQGPITGEQTWTYTAKDNATEVVANVDYTIPGKLLGKFADKIVVEKLQERSAEHTLENLKVLCEAEITARVHV